MESELAEKRGPERVSWIVAMSSLRKTFSQRGARGLISLAVLFAVFAAIVPLPVGSRPEKDRSQPFPCQNRPCGCRSADQCWKKCCCFTNAQKVAWAKANRVKPPEFVVVAADHETSKVTCKAKSCCTPFKSPTASHVNNAACAADQDHSDAKNTRGSTSPMARREPPAPTYVIGIMAQHCQGEGWSWNSLPWSILPTSSELPRVIEVLIATSIPLSESCPLRTLQPPEPPPRRAPSRLFLV